MAGLAAAAVPSALPTSAPAAREAAEPTARAARVKCVPLYPSRSLYRHGRVYAIRGVSCATAIRVARAYDNSGRAPSPWRCGLAHNDLPRLFSCGYPAGRGGGLQTAPHAFEALGVQRR